ncbi:hypothetical protein [Paraburkholderia franconis]|nr:hypothetical protein [Paraburkholderia franconis]
MSRWTSLTVSAVSVVPHFLLIMPVVASTDLVAMIPARLVGDAHGLRSSG